MADGPYDLAFHEKVFSEVEAKENEAKKEVKQEPEVPVNTGNASKENQENQESANKDGQEESQEQNQDKSGLYAKKYQTIGQLFKACEVIAAELDEEVDIAAMNAKEAETYYLDAQKRFFSQGFKHRNKERANQVKQAAKRDELNAQQLDAYMAEQNHQTQQASYVPKTVVFDKQKYGRLMFEDPDAAAEMLDDYISAKIDSRVEAESVKYGKVLHDQVIVPLNARRQAEAANDSWLQALRTVDQFVTDHGDGQYAFKSLEKDMNELVQSNPRYYKALLEEEGPEQTVFELYRKARERAEIATEKARLEQEKLEFAKLKNGEVDNMIQTSKEAGRIANSTGNVTPKVASGKKLTEAEQVHLQLSRKEKKGPYDMDY